MSGGGSRIALERADAVERGGVPPAVEARESGELRADRLAGIEGTE